MDYKAEKKRWQEETLQPTLAQHPERKLEFQTSSGIPLPPLLTPSDFCAR